MAAKSGPLGTPHGVPLSTLKECLMFLEWLNSRKGEGMRKEVTDAFAKRIGLYYNNPTYRALLASSLRNFLGHVSSVYEQISKNTTPWENDGESAEQITQAFSECLSKVHSALSLLLFHVDYAYGDVGGGSWSLEETNAGENALQTYLTTEIDYLYNGVIPGGFDIEELKPLEGIRLAHNLNEALKRNISTPDVFTSVLFNNLDKDDWHKLDAGNVLLLLWAFCDYVKTSETGGELKKNLQDELSSKGMCFKWDKLVNHCTKLKSELSKLFGGEDNPGGFSTTGRAFTTFALKPEAFAEAFKKWFENHWGDIGNTLDAIKSRVEDLADPSEFEPESLYPYGIVLNKDKQHEWHNGLTNLPGVLEKLGNSDNGDLKTLKEILEGDRCPAQPPPPPPPPPPPAKPVVTEAEAAKPTATKTEATKTEASKPVVTKAEAAKPTATKTEATKTEAAKPVATKAEAAKPTATKAEPTKPTVGKTEATSLQGGKADGTPNQDKKSEGAQNQGKIAEGEPTAASPQSPPPQPSSDSSPESSPGAPGSSSDQVRDGQVVSSGAAEPGGRNGQTSSGGDAMVSTNDGVGGGGMDVEPMNSKDQATASVTSNRCDDEFIDIGGGSKICVLDPKKSKPPMRYLDPQNKIPSDPNFDDVWEKGYKKSLNQEIEKNIQTNKEKQNLRSRTIPTLPTQPIRPAPGHNAQPTGVRNGHGHDYYELRGRDRGQGGESADENAFTDTPAGFIDGMVIPNDSDIKLKRLRDRIELFHSAYNNSHVLQEQREKEEDEQIEKESERKRKEAELKWQKEQDEGKRVRKYDDDVDRIEQVLERGKIQSAQKKLEEQRRIEAERKYQEEMEQYKRRLQQQRIDFANTFVGDVITNPPDSPSYQYDNRLFPLVDGNIIPYKFQVNERQMESSELYTNQLAAKRLVRDKHEQQNEKVNEAIKAAEEKKKKDEKRYALDQFKGKKDFLKDLWRVENFQVSRPQPDEPPETVDVDDIIIHPRVFATPPLETHDPIRLSNYMLEPLAPNVLLEINRSRHRDSTFKPADLSFKFQKNDALSSPRFAPIPPNISLHIATPPKEENVENSIQDAYGAGISKSLFIDIPKPTLQYSIHDTDFDFELPPLPNVEPLEPLGPSTPAINLNLETPEPLPELPNNSAADYTHNPSTVQMCLAPWATQTITPGSTDIPETELFPAEAPRTVREMLQWLAGLKNPKHHGTLRQCINKAFTGPHNKSSDLALFINRAPILPDNVFDILQLTAMFAGSVLTAIAPKWKANVSLKTVKPKSSDEPDCCALLCQLRDYAYACCHQLQFVKAQCNRDKLSGGWKNHDYGSDITSSKSALQAFLTDGWDSDFETHPFDPCNLCLKSRVRMGFRDKDLPSSQQTGATLSSILTPSCGGDDPLLTLSSYLTCLTRRTPRTTGELVSFFHNLGNSLHDMYLDELLPLGESLSSPHLDCPHWDHLGRHDLQAVKGIRGHESLISQHNSKNDHPRTLSTLLGCSDDSSNCPPRCSPITYRAYALYSQSFAHTYLGWTVYLPDRLHESLQKLHYDLQKHLGSDKCTSLYSCSTALPLLYLHGFTPPEVGPQQQLPCQQVIAKVKKVVAGQPIASLMTAMDNFLYGIREPFIFTLVALWSLAFLIFANTMLYRIDILHIRSHLIRTKASHLIDVKALLSDNKKMMSLYDANYFDDDPAELLNLR